MFDTGMPTQKRVAKVLVASQENPVDYDLCHGMAAQARYNEGIGLSGWDARFID